MTQKLSLINSSNRVPSVQDLNAYLRYAMGIPNLEFDEERKLLEDLHIKQNMDAAKTLILSQLKTVVMIARQYKNYGIPQEDLIQEGNIGLMKAVKNYDISQKVRLYTYALLWIKAEMQGYILKNWKMVKIATTNNMKKLFFNFRKIQQEMISLGLPKHKAQEYIASKLEVSEEEVKEISEYFASNDLPILLEDNSEDKEDNNYQQIQLIERTTPDSIFFDKSMQESNTAFVKDALAQLNDKQKSVIQMRFLNEEKQTHKEIAQELGISSERVRQIENESLSKLKKIISEDLIEI